MSVRRSRRELAAVAVLVTTVFLLLAGATEARGPKQPKRDGAVVAGEVIVRFSAGTSESEREAALDAAGIASSKKLRAPHTKLAKTSPAHARRALKLLTADPRVEYAEPNYRVNASAERVPNDPSFAELWGLRNTGQSVNGFPGTADADIDADEAWATTTGSSDVVVAVIDTGVDFGHPDLAGRQWTNAGENCAGCRTDGVDNDGNGYVDDWRGWDFVNDDNNPFDDEGHGTHVAGTIGATGDNGVGVTGVSWNTSIMALKFLDELGSGTTDDAIEAVRYATAMRVPIVNNSWGGEEFSQALLDAIEDGDAAGSLFVAAAGNDGLDSDDWPMYPASYDVANVVSVAASDQDDALAWFSNFGRTAVDIAAPGTSVYSTIPGGRYDWYDGTSMASPHVAGAAALAKAAHPTATGVGLKALLLRTVDARPSLTGNVATGGRLNVGRAVTCVGTPQAWLDSPAPGFTATVGEPLALAVAGTSCGSAAGATTTVTVNGSSVALTARGDGLFTGTYVPTAAGPLTVTATVTTASGSDTRNASGIAELNYRVSEGSYAWVDATAGGVRLTLGDDDARSVALPFAFSFYDVPQSTVQVTSNGHLVFGPTDATVYFNSTLPWDGEPNGVVAPYWDDLNPTEAGSIWYRTVGSAPSRRFVVAWVDVPAWGGGDGVTFEAILEEATGDIVFQYKDVDHSDPWFDWGGSATIGVENAAGEVGREFAYDRSVLQPYQAAKSLRFSIGASAPPPPPAPDTTPPAAPASLVATGRSAAVELDWADNAEGDLASYRVELRNADGTWSALTSVTSSAFTHTGLVNGTAYTYRVVAVDQAGNAGAPSSTVTATPVAAVTYAPGGYTIQNGTVISGSLASLAADDGNRLVVDARQRSGNYRAELRPTVTIPADRRSGIASLRITFDGHASTAGAAIRLRALNQTTGMWDLIDGPRSGVTSDRLVSWTASVPADYVSATGLVQLSVFAQSSADFRLRADLASVTIE